MLNSMRIEKRLIKKLTWIKLELSRIKLNPDQAVLSCCELSSRGVALSSMPSMQCLIGLCITNSGPSAVSS